MWRLLETLRRKPKVKREQLAFLGALICTACIALVWISTLPERLSQTATVVSSDVVSDSDSALRGFLAGVRERLQQPDEALEALLELEDESDNSPDATASATPVITIPQLASTTIQQVAPRVIQLGTSTGASSTIAP